MSDKQAPQSIDVKLGDIYHVMFRHKWTILCIWAMACAVAMALHLKWPVPYQSETKLFIRYIEDTKAIGSMTGDSSIKTPDSGVLGIINSETEILTSLDVAEQVADAIGPAKILSKSGGGSDRFRAAAVVRQGLSVEAPDRSSVMIVTFKNLDPEIVQPILAQVVDAYLKKHAEIHQTMATMVDYVTQTTDQLKSQLDATEQELRAEKLKSGVTSLDDTKRTLAEQRAKIQEAMDSAQAELAQREAMLPAMTNVVGVKSETNLSVQTMAVVPAAKLADYKRICNLLDNLTKLEQNRLLEYLPESSAVQGVRDRIAASEKTKSDLEQQYPQLIAIHTPAEGATQSATSIDISAELAGLKSLQARIGFLTNRLAEIQTNIANVDNAEAKIIDLQRKRDLQEQYYRNFSDKLQRDRINDMQAADKIGNIKVAQAPSPPFKSASKLLKLIGTILFGGFAGGIALAFLIEMYLDRSFKRPIEIEGKLGVPLFMAIPRTKLNGSNRPIAKLLDQPGASKKTPGEMKGEVAIANEVLPLKTLRRLQPYFEALRDRLITYFEVKNLTHKPKLVAVTSCGRGSGVTTVASGLAASLSETGEGNVLLVDMNSKGGAAHHFHRGQLDYSLDDALELEKRDNAMVQENLYIVTEDTKVDNVPRILQKRFAAIIPKLKASDYDYIIFDMPPVSQISPTPRLARFMDIVVMVVEAEKTDRDVAKRAACLLLDSKANLGVVLNKNHSYVPRKLQQEL